MAKAEKDIHIASPMYLVLNVFKCPKKKKKLRVPRKMCKLRPGTQVPLFFHSSQPHLNVWLTAVKSLPWKRDEKGTKEDRKKVWWWCFDSVKLYSEASTNCTENLSVLLQNFVFFESTEQYLLKINIPHNFIINKCLYFI